MPAPNVGFVSTPASLFSFTSPLQMEQSAVQSNIRMSMPMGIPVPTMAMSTPAVSTSDLWDLEILMRMVMQYL